MIEPIYPALGAVIRALRRNRGLSQQQLAGLLGILRPSLTEIENGNRRLQIHELLLLSEIFDMPLSALLSGTIEGEQGRAMAVKDTAWREY